MKTKSLFILLTTIISHATSTTCVKAQDLLWTADWSYDDQYIAVAGDVDALTIFRSKDHAVFKMLPFEGYTIARVAWHPSKNLLAFTGYPHNRQSNANILQILDVESGKSITLGGGKYGGRGLCWSPDGNFLALAGDGIQIFTKEGELVKTIKHASDRSLFSISWHPTKNLIAAAEEDIRIYDTHTGVELRVIKTSEIQKAVLCVQWHPSGKFLASGDYGHENETEPSYLKFWTEDGEHIKTMKGSKGAYRGIQWNAAGSKIATGSDSLRVWSTDGDLIFTANPGKNGFWGVDWNRTGDKILTGGTESSVLIWDDKGKLIKKIR